MYMKVLKKIVGNYLFWLFIVCLIIYFPLINKVAWGHDIEFHLTNMEMFTQNITKGLFNHRLFGSGIANGFGYGTFLFYPCLSYIITSLIGLALSHLGLDYLLAISYTQIMIAFLSGVTMYNLMKKVSKDNMIAFLSSAFYITSTYFLCDIYIRTAIAESLIFIFIPVIFSSLYELFFGSEYKFYLLFVIGYVGIINAHLVMSIYVTIFILILLIMNFRKVFTIKTIKKLSLASLLVLLISSPYLITILEHKLLGNYVVFDNKTMFSSGGIMYHALRLFDYVYIGNRTSNGIIVYLNYLILLSFLIVIIFHEKIFTNQREQKIYYHIALLTIIVIYISTRYFPWPLLPSFLKNIQFPWRLCTIITFLMAVIAGNIIKLINPNYRKLSLIVIVIATILFDTGIILNNHDYVSHIDNYDRSLGNDSEYLPSNIKNNLFYYRIRDQLIHTLAGVGNAKITENDVPNLLAEVNLESDSLTLELPRIYYLGYKITLKDEHNKIHKITYTEDKYGFIQITIKNNGILKVTYTGTLISNIFRIISLITIVSFPILLRYLSKRQRNLPPKS